MRIIDEKGRLFGRINIIDLNVMLIFFSFISVLYLGYKLTTRRVETKTISVNIGVRYSEIMPELARVIKTGDIERDWSGKVVGKITHVSDAVPSEVVALRMNNQLVTTVSNTKINLSARLHIICDDKNGLLYYKEQPVKIGKDIIFSTNLYTVTGAIADIEQNR